MDFSKVIGIDQNILEGLKSLSANDRGCFALLEYLAANKAEQTALLQKAALGALHNPDLKVTAYQLEGSCKTLQHITETLTKIFKGKGS